MRFEVVTIFPAMIERALEDGILGRAIGRGALVVKVHDLRDFTTDRHRVVDDVPYGGGPGMVMKPEPLFRALDAIQSAVPETRAHVALMSPQGLPFTQGEARRLSTNARLVLVCGRYEGIDERVRSRVDVELSIGDFVLSGGELAALVVIDAVARLVPGVVGDAQSVEEESFSRGLLDFPHYTRPAQFEWPGSEPGELNVPDVLVSGNHAQIRKWRKREAIRRTLERRPDLIEAAVLDEEERDILRELLAHRERGVGERS